MARIHLTKQNLAAAVSGAASTLDLGSIAPTRVEEQEIASLVREVRQLAQARLNEQTVSGSNLRHERVAKQRLLEQIRRFEVKGSGKKLSANEWRVLTNRMKRTGLFRTLGLTLEGIR